MDIDTLINILKKTSFLQELNYPLHDLARKLRLERFNKDANIFYESEEGTSMYFIIAGKVLIYSRSTMEQEMVLQTLGPSDFFGETSLLDGGGRSTSARTMEDSIIFSLERKDFLDFLNNNPKAAIKIIETLSKMLRQSNIRNKILTETNRRLSILPAEKGQNAIIRPDKLKQGSQDQQERTIRKKEELDLLKEAKEYDLKTKKDYTLSDMLNERLTEAEQVFKEHAEQSSDNKKELDLKDMLYHKKAVCPICDTKFESPKVFSKYILVRKMDYDFCNYYKFINPLFYEMMVCPTCGCAFNEEISGMRLNEEQQEAVRSRLLIFWQNHSLRNYRGVRTLEQAIETFQLALFALEGRPVKNSQMGMLHLKTAWLYRYKGDEARERKCIEKAIANFSAAFEKESFSSPKSEIHTTYLLGVLNIHAGHDKEAAKWLERVVRHPFRSMFPMVMNQARDLWSEVRQKVRKEKQRNEQED
ncbi:MAG: Uncharacterized protein XD97_0748 [Pelotomaculum thermopropionicum]|uniref:Cyclic nucleotide-binding domain-containing protein n=1 Tax=Pelotomaculum thermopropionicum TaxID=110500 RepID=A0A101HQ34_9FIRM|nr:MAG: Uncharacterized protein XD97_0748 [Pelotomaculum thermopropionicum]